MTTINKQQPNPGVRQENLGSAPGRNSPVGGEVSRGQLGTRVPVQRPAPQVGTERN
jgi:hypothetical protein